MGMRKEELAEVEDALRELPLPELLDMLERLHAVGRAPACDTAEDAARRLALRLDRLVFSHGECMRMIQERMGDVG